MINKGDISLGVSVKKLPYYMAGQEKNIFRIDKQNTDFKYNKNVKQF